jgi:hypothetical protein
MVTDDTFLAMMENTVLHHVLMGSVSQLDGTLPHLSSHIRAFLDRKFPDLGYEERDPSPGPSFSRCASFESFLAEVYKILCLS